MNKIATAATALAAGLAGGLIAFAPIAAADPADGPTTTAPWQENAPISAESGAPEGDQTLGTDPLIPFGTDPQSPVRLGYVDRNHDEGITANGEVDTAI